MLPLKASKISPTLSWPTPTPIPYGATLDTAQLNATASVPGSFAYTPAAGTLLTAGAQTISVVFTPEDTETYTSVSTSVTLTVKPATPKITWPTPAAITADTTLGSAQLNATASVPGSFAYTPAAGSQLTAGAQSLSLVFTPTDTENYTSTSASVTLAVKQATPKITWPVPAAINAETTLGSAQLNATASVPGSFVYTPAAGTLLTAGAQPLSLVFTPTDTKNYASASASVTLAVKPATPEITWPAPAAISAGTTLGSAQLNATASVPGSFAYTPAAGSHLTAGAQPLSLVFTPQDTKNYTSTSASVTLTVKQATPRITWPTPAAIAYGATLGSAQLNATASIPGSFAYTPAAGSLLSVGAQPLSLVFTPKNTKDYTSTSASVVLTVKQTTPTITWSTPAAIAYGTTLGSAQLNATASVPGSFVYTPAAGALLTAGAQTLSLVFTPKDTENYTSATASVVLTIKQTTPKITWPTPAAITYGTTLSSAQLSATASVPGSFAYTPATGSLLTAGAQTLSLAFTPKDTKNYTSATASVTLTVKQTTPKITWPTPAAITYGTTLGSAQLNATASVPGSFVYTPATGALLTAGAQTLSLAFTPKDTENYTSTSASVTLTVKQTTPKITWAAPAAITYGTTLSSAQLNATASVPGSFVYTPATGSLLTAGAQTLSLVFTPKDTKNYTSATASVVLTIKQTTPKITWPTPTAIAYGTTLSSAQLNATASVPGSFAYTPATGALLTAGAQTLSLVFTPTDTKNYTSATASVTLTVKQTTPKITWSAPAAIAYGTTLSSAQLNATASVPGSFVYTPATGALLTIGTQSLSVAFTPTDAKDYTSATASVTLTVKQTTPKITWATPAAITYGSAIGAAQLNAKASVPGVFVYTPASGTLLGAGAQSLSVFFTPNDTTDYSSVSGGVTLNVQQATPKLTWATPPSVPVGYALSSTQLNAAVTAPGSNTPLDGSYLYTPDAGTVFSSSGPQTLNVTFTPTNSQDYAPVEASQTLTVTSVGLAAWGDSLTVGSGSSFDRGNYPQDLLSLVSLTVQNEGVSGQTSTQIGVRQGAVPTYATVSGGVIPASGGVTVTFPTGYEPATIYGPSAGVTGTILGVHGTVTFLSNVSTFTRTTAGDPVSAPGSPKFVVDTPYVAYLPVFWEGRNNYRQIAQILSDLAAQVATVPSGHNYLVMSVINQNAPVEWKGGAEYNTIIALNNQLATTYQSHYLDIRKVLVNSYDQTQANDAADYQHDVPPTSLHALESIGTLSSAIGPSDTTFTVNITTGQLCSCGLLNIDTGQNAETTVVSSASGNTVTVVRGFSGANIAHAAGVATVQTDPMHLNAKGYQVVANAVAQYFSAYGINK